MLPVKKKSLLCRGFFAIMSVLKGGLDMSRPVLIIHEDPWYVAEDVVTKVTSEGETVEEAMDNLREALELYNEDNEELLAPSSFFLTSMEVRA